MTTTAVSLAKITSVRVCPDRTVSLAASQPKARDDCRDPMAAKQARQEKLPFSVGASHLAALLDAQYGSGRIRPVMCLIVLKPAHFKHLKPQK
jgi:hypothetical protein